MALKIKGSLRSFLDRRSMVQKMYFTFYLLVLALSLSGCNYCMPDSETIVSRGWADNNEEIESGPLYCYDTLADKACFTRPIENEEERLRGYYGPKP